MRLTVSLIPESGIQEELKLTLALYEDAREEEVRARLKVSRLGDRVFVDGLAESAVSVTCSRCLKTFVLPLKTDFNVEYVPYREAGEEGELELTDSLKYRTSHKIEDN